MRSRSLLISAIACVLVAAADAKPPAKPPPIQSQTRPVATVRELIQMGGAMADMKRFNEAITAYTLALDQEPDNWEAHADRALAYAWINRIREASDDLAAAEKIMPDTAVVHRVKAILANRRSDEDTELAELTKSLQLEPDNPFALSFRASIYAERQQYEAALADIEAYIRARPNEPYAYQDKAEILAAERKWPLAIAQAEILTKRFSEDPRALASAAEIYRDADRRDKALEIMNQAIALDETFFDLWKARAGIRRWDDFAGRRLDLDEALELAPGDLSIITQIGLLEFDQQNWAAARARFTEELNKESKDFGVLAYRAMTALKSRDQQGARKDYQAAVAVSSGPGDLSRVCWALGNEGLALDWARSACDRAVQADPKKSSYRINRGLVRLREGDLDGAIVDYDQALVTNPNSAAAYYGRALAYSRKGDANHAKSDRAQAQSIKPIIAESFVAHGLGDLETVSQQSVHRKDSP